MKPLLLILALMTAFPAAVYGQDNSSICDLAINRICNVQTGPKLKHARLQLMDDGGQFDLIGGAAWRISYYRYLHQIAAVLEQAKGGHVWWDVYLLGRDPNIRFQFETTGDRGVQDFTVSPYHGLKTCLADTPQVCDQVIAVKQILAGHLESNRLHWRVGPGIFAALDYVMAECEAHLGRSCGDVFISD